jgi:hypothetical protein
MVAKERIPSIDNGGRRWGFERRKVVYAASIPERRLGLERRSGKDRRKRDREQS